MEPFIGQITMFGGNFAPRGWALCEGQLLPIAQNQALFSIIGTIYGGDGRTNFALPDLRGRIPLQQGSGPGLPSYQLGQRGGAFSHTITLAQMPAHTHDGSTLKGVIQANSEDGDSDEPEGRNFGNSNSGTPYNTSPTEGPMAADNVSVTGNTGSTGGNQSYSIQNPYLGINFIIALQGVFPSRN